MGAHPRLLEVRQHVLKKNDLAARALRDRFRRADTYVVSPLFFPGGDIGKLAVHGTINDLAMAGAEPLYLSTVFDIFLCQALFASHE